MSGCISFEEHTALCDWPMVEETGVGGMEEGFTTDEAMCLGIADVVQDVQAE